jgi:hypothetical protein
VKAVYRPSSVDMIRPKRLVIVRSGATELYDLLLARFGNDPETVVLYDRRGKPRRVRRQPTAVERRRGERRLPQDPSILVSRGYFVTRQREAPARA